MNNPELLDHIFWLLLAGKFPEAQIIEFNQRLDPSDAKWLIEYIEKLKGPEQYMDDLDEYIDANNLEMGVITEGFFKFIDLVSAFIIKLGEEAIQEAKNFENSQSPYVPWILKYCTDERLQDQIPDSFPQLQLT